MPPSPRWPGPYTWSLRWPALGLTLNAPFGASEWLPGRFWLTPVSHKDHDIDHGRGHDIGNAHDNDHDDDIVTPAAH